MRVVETILRLILIPTGCYCGFGLQISHSAATRHNEGRCTKEDVANDGVASKFLIHWK